MSYLHNQNPRYSPPPMDRDYNPHNNNNYSLGSDGGAFAPYQDSEYRNYSYAPTPEETLAPPQLRYTEDGFNNSSNSRLLADPSNPNYRERSDSTPGNSTYLEKTHLYGNTSAAAAAAAAAAGARETSDNNSLYGFTKEPVKRRRRCRCCSCCCTKKYWAFCVPITLVIIAGLAVAGYFLWPRIPQAEFDRIDVRNSNSASSSDSSSGSLADQFIGNIGFNRQGMVTLPLEIHMNVSNPNFIPWTINNVTVDGFINLGDGKNSKFPVGKGGLPKAFKMPKKSVDNDMVIFFNFKLDVTQVNYKDAAEMVQKSCVKNGPPLKFSYDAKVEIKPISGLGIKPKISNTVNFDCPLKGIGDLGIDIKQITGL
ncbi:hypothetical protein H4219_002570 [Mycoemilia scoparia]|uniref:Late embryogenesis abundant protein LEA-2 subgroup domain-containing protein n=1 Tax=Mycoemilia scoparia TaxID=417184 RepID=A0A9W7ZX90_9FUNG|nr:hypothetical protein H4219_002570 [Mycoemilia scoparia]